MALLKLEGEIIISTATIIGTFGGSVITIPIGRYFLTSIGSGGATRSFLDELDFQLTTVVGGVWTCTLNDDTDAATGKVTIATSFPFDVTWTSTTLRDLLGFTANLGLATSHTSPNHAKYLWLPNCGRSAIMAPAASGGALESDFTLALGTDGTPFGLGYTIRAYDSLELRHLRGKKVWTSQGAANEALEGFWRLVIAFGLRLRFHADRSIDATYRTWVVEDAGHFDPVAFDERWTEGAECLWAIRYRVRETT